MSRGHGQTQRAILAYLSAGPREHRHAFRRDGSCPAYDAAAPGARADRADIHLWPPWRTVHALAAALSGGPASRAEVESVRRACKRLAAEGLAEVGYSWGETFRDVFTVHATMLAVRAPLCGAERLAEEAMYEAGRECARQRVAAARAGL